MEENNIPHKPEARPQKLDGVTARVQVGCGKYYITLNLNEKGDKLFEVFNQLGKSGGCLAAQNEAVARLISLALRAGVPVEEIITQLQGIRCSSPMLNEGVTYYSCADAMAKVLQQFVDGKLCINSQVKDKEKAQEVKKDEGLQLPPSSGQNP